MTINMQYASSVQPNPKCEGCLHYDSQHGKEGVCEIGVKPWICGDGMSPDMGYAPIAMSRPTSTEPPAPTAQVYAGAGDEQIAMPTVVLGEEHVQMIKSFDAQYDARERSSCPTHQQRVSSQGQTYGRAGDRPLECVCSPASDKLVAKSVYASLKNRERAQVTPEEMFAFVHSTRKAQ